jgi:hypothetical protein
MPESDLERTVEFFRIECGFFYGDVGDAALSFLVALLFCTMSTGTGFIITFEFLRLDKEGLSAFYRDSFFLTYSPLPQLISFEALII